MSKNGLQLTIPALLKRKRRLDNIKEDEEAKSDSVDGTHKRRSFIPTQTEQSELIILDTPERSMCVDTSQNESPEKHSNMDSLTEVTFSQFRDIACTGAGQASPLPELRWAESGLMWKSLLNKDLQSTQQRGEGMFTRNPQVQPRMRSILLDWLIEVSDVYKLHRETYYLAQDYVDRVLLVRKDTPKQDLQLLGITCLFLAAKVEEIYPPKVAEFAYVTDGACTEAAILEHEMSILTALEWDVCPLTPAGWLRFYLQLACQQRATSETSEFEMPRFPCSALPLVSKLLDLATLDAGCVQFRYSVLAAASLALVYGRYQATVVSRLDWKELRPCVAWMAPFAVALSTTSAAPTGASEGEAPLTLIDEEIRLRPDLVATVSITLEDAHNLQNHAVSMEMLEVAQTLLNDSTPSDEDSVSAMDATQQTPCSKPRQLPPPQETPEGMLTPPASTSRSKPKHVPTCNAALRPTELFIPLSPST